MNAKQQREYWLKVERLRNQLDIKYSSLFNATIRKDLKQFASDLKDYGARGALSRMGSYAWNDEMMKLMNKLYKEATVIFGNAVYRAIGINNQKSTASLYNTEWVQKAVEFLVQYGFLLVSDITQTTKAKLQDILSKGLNDGLSVYEIVRLILDDRDNGYSMMRATRIVRTEVMRASNYASMIAANQHEFEVDKIWISRIDNRTRRIPKNQYDHINMNGQKVGWDEDFTSTGKKGDLVLAGFPGDPTTPAGFTINCRCTVGFEGKRDTSGKLIRKK
jgi:hypothetical protein